MVELLVATAVDARPDEPQSTAIGEADETKLKQQGDSLPLARRLACLLLASRRVVNYVAR